MDKSNIVFIATSLDGYISDRNEELNWLNSIPNPDNHDMGYVNFIESMDAVIMGRKTFQTVCQFDIDWPYKIPVFILSNTLDTIDENYKDKAELISGGQLDIVSRLNKKGYNRLYIDGGATIQGFLKYNLIDEMIITTIPILLGGGIRLFSHLENELKFEHVSTKVFLGEVVQSHYKRSTIL